MSDEDEEKKKTDFIKKRDDAQFELAMTMKDEKAKHPERFQAPEEKKEQK